MSILTDTFSYISPAKVRCLVVPVNGCSEQEFRRYLELVRRSHEVRLLDIGVEEELQSFNPQTFPMGRIMFEYLTHLPDNELIFLEDFEPFRKVFIVLGVGPYRNEASGSADDSGVLEGMRKRFSEAIVHNVILFDTPSEIIRVRTPAADHSKKTEFYHEGTETHNITALETIMCGVARNLLGGFEEYASSYLSITLRSPISLTDGSTLSKSINLAQKKLGSNVSFKSAFGTTSPTSTQQSTENKSKTQLRQQGRQNKLMGNLFLLTGKYNDALQSFTEAISSLRKCDDYLWLGSSIEGLALSITMLSYVGVTYNLQNPTIKSILQIPKSKFHSITNPNTSGSLRRTSNESTGSQNGHLSVNNSSQKLSITSPRNSTSSLKSSTANNLTVPVDPSCLALPEIIKSLSSKVVYYYVLSTNNFENVIPDIAYVEFLLRTIKFMISTYLDGEEFDSSTLERIVNGVKVERGYGHSENYFTRQEIVAEIDKIYSLQLVDLSTYEQCKIYSTLATMYEDLGMVRKQAFVLRILLVSVLPKIESSINIEDTVSSFSYGVTIKSHQEGLRSTKLVIQSLFDVYGINQETEISASEASRHSSSDWIALQLPFLKLCLRIGESTKDYVFLSKICILLLTRYLHCLPPDDQFKLKQKLDEAIALARRSNLHFCVPYWDPFIVRRIRLINDKSKEEILPFPNYEEGSENVKVVDDGNDSIDVKAENGTPQPDPFIFNPYKKGTKKQFNSDEILIADEVSQLMIRLQNPFAFEIDISDISVVTDTKVNVETLKNTIKILSHNSSKRGTLSRAGTESAFSFKNSTGSTIGNHSGQLLSTENNNTPLITIPATSMVNFSIGFKPKSPGELNITGVELVIGNCSRQTFKISEKERTELDIKIKPISEQEIAKPDKQALDKVIANLCSSDVESSRVVNKKLALTVIPIQPHLSLISSSISNNWIMLLEGERSTFSLCLANTSNEVINYLSFSFWDSTMDTIDTKLRLNNKQYPVTEIYEMEWHLLKSKPFKILNRADISEKYRTITMKKEVKFHFEITGKRGMKESKIMFEYSHKSPKTKGMSFVKFLDFSLNVTVLPSLDVAGCNVIPFHSSFVESYKSVPNNEKCTQLEQLHDFLGSSTDKDFESLSKYCIFIVDLRNSFSELLRAELAVKISTQTSYKIEATIEPGKTHRFLLPMPKIQANGMDSLKPIPSLRNKQFVKNYSITLDEDTRMKKIFWVRETLLERITGTWNTVRDSSRARNGLIDMRNIRITSKMVDSLLVPYIKIRSSIVDESTGEPVEPRESIYQLETNKFYTHRAVIVNDSDLSIGGTLRHSVSLQNSMSKAYTSIDRKILINGHLQDRIDKSLTPGEYLEIDTSFVVLERGDYEWGLIFDSFDQRAGKIVGRHPLLFSAV